MPDRKSFTNKCLKYMSMCVTIDGEFFIGYKQERRINMDIPKKATKEQVKAMT